MQFHPLHTGVYQYAVLIVTEELRLNYTITRYGTYRLIRGYRSYRVVLDRDVRYGKHSIANGTLRTIGTIVHSPERTDIHA